MISKSKMKDMLKYYSRKQLNQIVDCKSGKRLAHYLAKTGKWMTNNRSILILADKSGFTVAHYLAQTGKWMTNDKDILLMHTNRSCISVAHYLAVYNPVWATYDRQILNKANKFDHTVKSHLIGDKKKYHVTKHKNNVLFIIPII